MSEAVFMHKGAQPELEGNLSGVPELFALLKDRDINPLISVRGEDALTESGITARGLDDSKDVEASYKGTLLINRLNRTIASEKIPDSVVLPNIINENAARDFTTSKSKVYEHIFRPLGFGIPTAFFDTDAQTQQFIGGHPAPSYVVRPERGFASGGIVVKSHCDGLMLDADETTSGQIIQPRYTFNGRLPTSLKPYDTAAAELFDSVNKSDANKELRVYGFHSGKGTETFAVGRAITDAVDEWFFVDPDTLPGKVYQQTEYAIEKLATQTGSTALFGTLDFGYGTLADEDPDWHVIELNSKQPYMISYKKHHETAHRLRTMFADQIRASI